MPSQPGDVLAYAWDLDGDGQFDDSNAPQPSFIYTTDGITAARLRVSDDHGGFAVSDPRVDRGRQPGPDGDDPDARTRP